MRWWHPFLLQPGYSQALAGPGQSWCQVLLGLESWARNPTSKLDDVLPHHKLQCYNNINVQQYIYIYTIICNHIQSYTIICNRMQSYAIICNSILYNNIQSSLIIIPALYFGKAAWNDKFILDHSLVVWLGMEAPKICSVHIMNCKTTSCTKIWGALWIQARFWPWNVRHLKRARWFANVHQDLGYGPSPRYSLCTTMSATVRILQIIPGYDSFLQIPKIT
jgi:hypothetical protein